MASWADGSPGLQWAGIPGGGPGPAKAEGEKVRTVHGEEERPGGCRVGCVAEEGQRLDGTTGRRSEVWTGSRGPASHSPEPGLSLTQFLGLREQAAYAGAPVMRDVSARRQLPQLRPHSWSLQRPPTSSNPRIQQMGSWLFSGHPFLQLSYRLQLQFSGYKSFSSVLENWKITAKKKQDNITHHPTTP